MAHVTLTIPEDLKAAMARFRGVDWTEVARHAIAEKARILDEAQHVLGHSRLTEQEAVEIGRQVKKRVWAKVRRAR